MARALSRMLVLVVVVVVLVVGLLSCQHWERVAPLRQALPRLTAAGQQPDHLLTASGFIQVDEILVSSEVRGRIRSLEAGTGDDVSAGQVLAQLDGALIDARIRRAGTEVQVAEAELARVEAGAAPQDIEIALADVRRADEEVALAEQGLALARTDAAIAQAAQQVAQAELAKLRSGSGDYDLALAEAQLRLARDQLRGAQSVRESIGGGVGRGELPAGSYDAAQAAVAQAKTRIRIAELQIEELRAGARIEDIQAAEAMVDAAKAEAEVTEARVARAGHLVDAARAHSRQAQAQLDLVRSGATKESVMLARALVNGARAAQQILRVQRKALILHAPRRGLVLERLVSLGETVMPGSMLFSLADLDQVTLTVYVPELDMGRVWLGQTVHVTVDSFPARVFPGRVVYISHRAEFIPSSVQTTERRASQVFAVRAELSNADHLLKPGMPADGIFIER